ncbi:hypothetical protein IWW35_001921 [Coemansia sp. RSA 1878]|nr:hypothetical protein IWW35_001921 [Coemansia sp. RSA 1878]
MSPFPTVEIGIPGNKVRVPRIGLGTMGLSMAYNKPDDKQSLDVLKNAIDIGCTFWDSADIYGRGHNEELLARVLKDHRKDIFLCTKFGFTFQLYEPGTQGTFGMGNIGINRSPDYVRKAAEASLARLGTDYIDLYYQHRMDPSVPIEDTVNTLAELVKEGKVRYIGLSKCTPEDIRRAHKVHPISAVQVQYSPWSAHIETNGVLNTCRELGITVVAYSPLGRGFMTGQIRSIDDLDEDDWRRTNPRFKPEHFENNLKLVDAFSKMAKKHGCTSAQLALAWLLVQEPNMVLLPGTKKIKYLDENFGASQVKLSDEDIKKLRTLVDSANIMGERY